MTARATATARTRERITEAMLQRFSRTPYDRIRLENVATDAQVTVQTVIRHFGSKAGLLAAMVESALGRLFTDRAAALGEEPQSTVVALVRYYEQQGALILKLYAEAYQAPGVPELAARGRAAHVQWCHDAFDDALEHGLEETVRRRRLAQVVTLCDVATWRILRVDCELSPKQTEQALLELLLPVLAPAPAPARP